MLTTNMVRKDLNSTSQYDAGVAISSLSCFVSPDVARDLANDAIVLLSSTKPYLRKRAVLLLYKIFLKFPDALRPAYPRLREKLEDADPGVQCAVVSVICELARKNPKNYLGLAPVFFKLMTSSTNNWLLIKIIKLFGVLTPLEPRLGKKLIEPLTNLIHSTTAMSLLYECINTVVAVLISISSGMSTHSASIQLCVQKLRILIEDSDQNLKYLGLLAMGRILLTHPKSVTVHKDLILQCLDDRDESIRLRALDLLYGMVTKKNLMEIVKKLMVHMERSNGVGYRDEIISKLVLICSQNSYHFVTSFEWYVSVLVELSRVEGSRHGTLVADQMIDVAVRVPTVRRFTVSQMALLLQNACVLMAGARANSMLEVLYAAAWICGEFGQHLTDVVPVIDSLLALHNAPLPASTLATCVHNAFKLYTRLCSAAAAVGSASTVEVSATVADNQPSADTEKADTEPVADNAGDGETVADDAENEKNDDGGLNGGTDNIAEPGDKRDADIEKRNANVDKARELLLERLPLFAQSSDLEVQERAVSAQQLLKTQQRLLSRGHDVTDELVLLFAGDLNPVAAKAQKKVPVPAGLDLETPIHAESDSEGSDSDSGPVFGNEVFVRSEPAASSQFGGPIASGSSTFRRYEPTPEELQRVRQQRISQQSHNPHYLGSGAASSHQQQYKQNQQDHQETLSPPPPIKQMDAAIPSLVIQGLTSSDAYLLEAKKKAARKTKKKKSKRKDVEPDLEEAEVTTVQHEVMAVEEMPDGAHASSGDDRKDERPPDDPHRALDIDLDSPLNPGDILPVLSHRTSSRQHATQKHPALLLSTNSDRATHKKKHRKHDKARSKRSPELLPDHSGDAQKIEAVNTGERIAVLNNGDTETDMRPKEPTNAVNGNSPGEKQHKSDKKRRHKKKSAKSGDRDAVQRAEPNRIVTLLHADNISLVYECEAVDGTDDTLSVKFTVTNATNASLTNVQLAFEFPAQVALQSQSDSANVTIADSLSHGGSAECSVSFSVTNTTTAHTINVQLGSCSEGEDVAVWRPCTMTLTSVEMLTLPWKQPDQQLFADLLGSGKLTARVSCVVAHVRTKFETMLCWLSAVGRMCVVERVDTTASMYARSLSGHHLCILVKQLDRRQFGIDGKSDCQPLLESVIEDLKTIVQQHSKH